MGSKPPKLGTYTPPAGYRVPERDDDIEQRLQDEQEAVAQLVDDAVEVLGNATPEAAKEPLRQQAQKLTPGARITARVLTKLRLDSRYPPKRGR